MQVSVPTSARIRRSCGGSTSAARRSWPAPKHILRALQTHLCARANGNVDLRRREHRRVFDAVAHNRHVPVVRRGPATQPSPHRGGGALCSASLCSSWVMSALLAGVACVSKVSRPRRCATNCAVAWASPDARMTLICNSRLSTAVGVSCACWLPSAIARSAVACAVCASLGRGSKFGQAMTAAAVAPIQQASYSWNSHLPGCQAAQTHGVAFSFAAAANSASGLGAAMSGSSNSCRPPTAIGKAIALPLLMLMRLSWLCPLLVMLPERTCMCNRGAAFAELLPTRPCLHQKLHIINRHCPGPAALA